jgi:hypothetical protein
MSCILEETVPRKLCNAFNRPTVNAELEPMPLRAGKSPS